jgi:hypothetical protein
MVPLAMVPAPEMVGLLAWWSIVLAAPVVLLRRRRRRRRGTAPHPLRRSLRRRPRETRLRRGAETSSGHPATSRSASMPSDETVAPRPHTQASARGGRHRPVSGAASTATSPVAGRSTATAPMPGRLSSETLEPLCRYVDFRRRLELAARELAAQLVQLPADRWRIEPYPLTGERRNTFVIIGETGIFVISASYAPGHWDDVIAVTKLARKIQRLLPGYWDESSRRCVTRSLQPGLESGIGQTRTGTGSVPG